MDAEIIITPNQQSSVDISVNDITVTIGMTNIGLAGPNSIGGYDIEVTDIQDGEILIFRDGKWINEAQANITNGGNF